MPKAFSRTGRHRPEHCLTCPFEAVVKTLAKIDFARLNWGFDRIDKLIRSEPPGGRPHCLRRPNASLAATARDLEEETMWINGPIGRQAQHRRSREDTRSVLVLVPHLVAGTRLMDLLPLIETDYRVQPIFTVPETLSTWHGTHEFVRAQGGLVMPWHQVNEYEFDLVLDASRSDTDPAPGTVLVTPHGAGSLRSRLRSRKGGTRAEANHGLVRENLMRHGTVIPSALILSHDEELDALRDACPPALPTAVVAGDICLDRLRASTPYRQHYRAALGIREEQTLVVVSSTWSRESLFGQRPELYERLVSELCPKNYRVAAFLHPNIWTVHGRRSIRAWLSDCTERGMLLLPPEEGWRAALIAADVVVGDHGSTTQYAGALGIPTMLGTFPEHNIRPGSPAARLGTLVPRFEPRAPVRAQLLDTIANAPAATSTEISSMLTSRPD